MSREAMQMALEALEILTDGYDGTEVGIEIDAMTALRQALETEQQPVANEVQLNIIRYWPEGFADRLEHVWEDLIGFIPNYKLYDLQKMLAEFGFTMVLYEGNRPPAHEWVGLTDEDALCLWTNDVPRPVMGKNKVLAFARAIEAKLKEKNDVLR